jgi:integrase
MEPLGLHEGRHSHASMLLAAGVPMKTMSVRLGHGSISTTIDNYSHLMPDAQQVAVEDLDRFLEKHRSHDPHPDNVVPLWRQRPLGAGATR